MLCQAAMAGAVTAWPKWWPTMMERAVIMWDSSSHSHIVYPFAPPSPPSLSEEASKSGGLPSSLSLVPLFDVGGGERQLQCLAWRMGGVLSFQGWWWQRQSKPRSGVVGTTAILATAMMRVHFDLMSPKSIGTITSLLGYRWRNAVLVVGYRWGGWGGCLDESLVSPPLIRGWGRGLKVGHQRGKCYLLWLVISSSILGFLSIHVLYPNQKLAIPT